MLLVVAGRTMGDRGDRARRGERAGWAGKTRRREGEVVRSRWRTVTLRGCACLLALCLTSAPALGEDGSEGLEAVRRALLAGHWDQAGVILERLRGGVEVDPLEMLFLTGMLSTAQGRDEQAIEAFRRILNQRPDLVRVRLELARALFRAGEDGAARHHFERALGARLPEAVEDNVRRYLEHIRRRRMWSLDVGVGILPDSNINTGSNQQYVSIGGLPFTLSTEAREKSGIGAQLSVQGTKSVRLADRWQLRAFGSALRRDYPDSVFDDMIVRGGIGPRRLFERGEFGIAPFYSERRFGNDILNRADGLRADGQWQFAPRFIAEGALEYQRVTYPSFPDRNGGVTWSFLGMRYLASAETQLLLGVDYYRDDARDPTFRNESTGWTLGHFRDWAWALSTGVTVRVADTQYQGIQPLFGEYRNDRFTTITANLTKRDWSFYDFVPTVSITFFDNDSSIPFYSFQRRQVLFAVNRRL
jgi:tetratricopeptide (TPR) repeat protein